MPDTSKDDPPNIPELSCEIINGIYVLRDMRYNPPKNVGLIKPKPFDRGWHYCPSVKMGLHFSCLKKEIPKKFRTAERAWAWTQQYASHWKPRKYTIFNSMIKWVAYAPQLFYLFRDFQVQFIFLKIALGGFSVLYAQEAEQTWVSVGFITLAVVLGLTILTDLGLFIHKWRSQK